MSGRVASSWHRGLDRHVHARATLTGLFLILLPPLAATYSLTMHRTGVPFFKLLICVAVFIAILQPMSLLWTRSRPLAGYLATLAAFTAYAVGSIAWAPDTRLAFAKINSLLLALALAYALAARRVYQAHHFRSLCAGWIIAVAIALSLAAVELLTGVDLYADGRFSTSDHIVLRSAFNNPNNFAVFLVLAIPFVLLAALQARRYTRLLLSGLWTAALVFIIFIGSRTGIVIMALQLGLLWVLLGKRPRLAIVSAIAIAATVIAFVLGPTQSTISLGPIVRGGETSLYMRLMLALNGLWMVVQSKGLGVGAGNFAYYIDYMGPPYPVLRGLNVPHNIWVEIAAEYGIIVFAMFVVFYLYLLKTSLGLLRAARARTDGRIRLQAITLITLVLTYPLAMVAPSHYVANPLNWLFLTSVVLFAKKVSVDLAVQPRDRARRRSLAAVAYGDRARPGERPYIGGHAGGASSRSAHPGAFARPWRR